MIPSGANAIKPHNCIKIESEPFFHADHPATGAFFHAGPHFCHRAAEGDDVQSRECFGVAFAIFDETPEAGYIRNRPIENPESGQEDEAEFDQAV